VITLDSPPLIYLGKSNALFIIRESYGKALIPPFVYQEVVEVGERKGFEDAEAVKNEIGKLLISKEVCARAFEEIVEKGI
jgi:hypothetical protein